MPKNTPRKMTSVELDGNDPEFKEQIPAGIDQSHAESEPLYGIDTVNTITGDENGTILISHDRVTNTTHTSRLSTNSNHLFRGIGGSKSINFTRKCNININQDFPLSEEQPSGRSGKNGQYKIRIGGVTGIPGVSEKDETEHTTISIEQEKPAPIQIVSSLAGTMFNPNMGKWLKQETRSIEKLRSDIYGYIEKVESDERFNGNDYVIGQIKELKEKLSSSLSSHPTLKQYVKELEDIVAELAVDFEPSKITRPKI